MRGLGIVVLIIGIAGVIAALSMDVSISSGVGRVANLNLMSQRQNLTFVAGLVALGGLLMIIFGNRRPPDITPTRFSSGTRTCPFCAEDIKSAATKCKHCGADVEPLAPSETALPASKQHGWTVRIPQRYAEDYERASETMSAAGLPLLRPDGLTVVLGAFEDKDEAEAVRKLIRSKHDLPAEVYWVPPPSED